MSETKTLLIIGGGFAGLQLARKLSNVKGIDITLFDKVNYHQFQPLFYQVATAGLDASNISFPLRKAFHDVNNVRVRLDEILKVNVAERYITTAYATHRFDALVLATGADTNFFGDEELAAKAYPMKSTVEAVQLRHKIISNFEQCLLTSDEALQQRLLTFVVVGGGPTGVELSGAIADMKRFVLPKDYPEIDFKRMRILLLEGSDKTLGAMSEKSSRHSEAYLKELGVEVRTGTIVANYDGHTVTLKDGSTISSDLVVWAAGIKGNVPEGIDPSLVVRGNRIMTDRFNQVKEVPAVYALGDVAFMETPLYPHGHPQVANVAINQAANLAANFKRSFSPGAAWKAFEYNDKGSMATVGRNKAVVDLTKPKIHFGGLLAWLAWMFLHLVLILGVKNRLMVFINWMYNYLTYDQSLRLIFKAFDRDRNLFPVKPPAHEASIEKPH